MPQKKPSVSNDWQQASVFLKAMANPIRLSILQHLSEGAQCVQEVNQIVNISQANLSQHLAILRKAGLVGCHSNGSLRCYYLLRPSLVKSVLKEMKKEHPERTRKREQVIREGSRHRRAAAG